MRLVRDKLELVEREFNRDLRGLEKGWRGLYKGLGRATQGWRWLLRGWKGPHKSYTLQSVLQRLYKWLNSGLRVS